MQTVLVIEDDPVTREIYLECLESEGFTAIGAENGAIGVHKLRQLLPDIVVCDIMMPEMDGYGMLSTLHSDPDTAVIPVIFLSAKSSKEDLHKGMKLGVDAYLTKPCTAEELLGAVCTCLNKRSMLERCYKAKWHTTQPSVNQITPTCGVESVPADCISATTSSLHSVTEDMAAKAVAVEVIFPNLCPRLTKVFDFLEANYHQPISLENIAQAAGYSPAYLTNLVAKKTGRTVYSWLIERRMVAARTLLLETDQSVEAIARSVGYLNLCNFFRQFRQHTGMTPKAWRQQQGTASPQKETL